MQDKWILMSIFMSWDGDDKINTTIMKWNL